MKKGFFFAAFLFLIPLLIIAQSREIRTEAKITDVTVYTRGARIFAEKRVEIPAGTSTIRFTGISSDMDTESIQAAAEGAVTILSVNHELDFLSEKEQSPAVKNLVKQREILQKNSEKEKMQLDVLDKEMQFMLANMKVTGTNTTTKVAELGPVFDYFSNKVTEITKGKKWRSDSIQSWTEQINKITSQIGDLMSQLKRPNGIIAVNIDASDKAEILFRINYVIRNAGWFPSYDIRVRDIESPVQFTYKANMFQNSGTDWKDVNLRFSSANPSQTGRLPELSPWWLDIQVQRSVTIRGYGVKQKDMIMDTAKMLEEVPVAMAMTQKEAGTAVEFAMGKLFSVPSSGKNFQVDISTVSLPAEYSYLSVPKIDPAAHLKAKLTNWEQLNLMPGEANVYFEGSFTGKTMLSMKDFTDTLEILLGIDRNIAIQRTLAKELSTTRFLASKTEVTKNWKLSVRNNKSHKINIILTDQLPLTANSDIEVNNTQYSGGKLNVDTGEVTWQMEVNPNEKAERMLSFTVRYPKGKKINLE